MFQSGVRVLAWCRARVWHPRTQRPMNRIHPYSYVARSRRHPAGELPFSVRSEAARGQWECSIGSRYT